MDHKSSAVNRHKPQDVVFVIECAEDVPIWSGHDFISLERFIDDMHALGFAVWVTPAAVYVFTGVVE